MIRWLRALFFRPTAPVSAEQRRRRLAVAQRVQEEAFWGHWWDA